MLDSIDLLAGTILIVDDNAINVSVAEAILKKEGYAFIDTCTVPFEVRNRYRDKRHDIVLLDIHMPGLSGLDVMQQLIEDFPDDYLPILVLTADTAPDVRLKALANGAKDFITKPFDKSEMRLRVRNILQVQLMQKALRQYNETLEQRVQERTRQLQESQISLIECLGRAAEFRDNETGQHVIRMSRMSARLGEAMGLCASDCDMLLKASPMHDLGKIGIPDSILLKPGALEADEWATMKQHTEIGSRILADVGGELLNAAATIASTHHERWDGSGYPNGLKGEEIPVFTRIVSICDVFDALLSARPYKQAWAVEDAIDHIRHNSGSHFDPEVVRVFESVLPQLLQIRSEHPDSIRH